MRNPNYHFGCFSRRHWPTGHRVLGSTVIATYGLIKNSGATVIGAMIIAPLMTPIMATTAALVMGSLQRALRSMTIVAVGVAGVVGLAALLSFYQADLISFQRNGEVAGRISPQLLDLFIALASGAAGAFAMSRSDVADSLPGVAIAISLVPPLCVVGIALAAGEYGAAGGAFLLFITNLLSILLAGGGVLALLGLGRAATSQLAGRERQRAFRYIALGVLPVALPLAATSYRIATEELLRLRVSAAAAEWLAETRYALITVTVRGDQVQVLTSGSGAFPNVDELRAVLQPDLPARYGVIVQIVPSTTRTVIEPPSSRLLTLREPPVPAGD